MDEYWEISSPSTPNNLKISVFDNFFSLITMGTYSDNFLGFGEWHIINLSNNI